MPDTKVVITTKDVGDYQQPPPEEGRYFLRTVERATWKRCRQRWYWLFVDRLQPIRSANPLRFGFLTHEALAHWYIPGTVRGRHPAETFLELYDEMLREADEAFDFGMKDEDEEWADARTLGEEMLTNYVDEYGNEPHIEIISSEFPFQIDVPDKFGRYLTTYAGKMDAVARNLNTGDLFLFEHKTTKAISTGHLPLDEQAGSYWAFAPIVLRHLGILKPKEPLRYILYNFLRKGKKDLRPQNEYGQYLNKNGTISKRQPSKLFDRYPVYRDAADRANLVYRVRAEAWEINRARNGKVPIYKNPQMGCAGAMGESKCPFYDMCCLHESGAEWQEMIDLEYKRWDPYEDHQDSIEEDEVFA